MNVLERVQGSNRITAQGHREIEESGGEAMGACNAKNREKMEEDATAPRWGVQLVPPWESLGRDLK